MGNGQFPTIRHRHKWKLAATADQSQTLHLDTWEMTHEVYQRYECRCGKAKILAKPVLAAASPSKEANLDKGEKNE